MTYEPETDGTVPAMDDPGAPITPYHRLIVWPFDLWYWFPGR